MDSNRSEKSSGQDDESASPEKRPKNRRRAQALLLSVSVFALASFLATRSAAAQESFKPSLAINIPTVTFSDVQVQNTNTEAGISGYVDIPWLAEYMKGAYTFSVSVAAVLAGVMVVIGGFRYLTAGGDASKVKQAKERISDAVVGLFLALGAYVMLYTLNPDLTIYSPLRIRTLKRVSFNDLTFNNLPMVDAPADSTGTAATTPSPPPPPTPGSPPRPPGPPPARGAAVPAAACSRSFVYIREIPGVDGSRFSGNYQIHTDLSAALVSLSQGLVQNNLRINIGGTTRTQESQFLRHVQIRSACADIYAGVPAPSNACNSTGHAAGRAIDLNVGGRQLCTSGSPSVNIPLFMYQHGWARLCVESWHYEPLEDHRSGLHGSRAGTQCFGSGNDALNNISGESGC